MSEHFLDDWKFAVDSEGVIRDQTGAVHGDNTGSRASERAWEQAKGAAEADTEEHREAYEELKWGDPDFETVRQKMAEMAAHVDPEDAERVNSNHRVFVEEYRALKNLMVGQEVDAPRHRALAQLREQLKAEDEMTGGRRTGRREELIQRIASLHGGGR